MSIQMKEEIIKLMEFFKYLLEEVDNPKKRPKSRDVKIFEGLRDQFSYFQKRERDLEQKDFVHINDYEKKIRLKYREIKTNLKELRSLITSRSYASRYKNEAILIGDINFMHQNAFNLLCDAERFFYDVLERRIKDL